MEAFTLAGATFKGGKQRRPPPVETRIPGWVLATIGILVALSFLSTIPSLYPRSLAEGFWSVERLRPVAFSARPSPGMPDHVDITMVGRGGSGVGSDPRLWVAEEGVMDPVARDPRGRGLVPLELRLTPGGSLSFLRTRVFRHRAWRRIRIDPASFRGFHLIYEEEPGRPPQSLQLPYPLVGLVPTELERQPGVAGEPDRLVVQAEVEGLRWTSPLVVTGDFLHPEREPRRRGGPRPPLMLLAVPLEDEPQGKGLLVADHRAPEPIEGPVVFRAGDGLVVFVPYAENEKAYRRRDLRGLDDPGEQLRKLTERWLRESGRR